MPAMERLSQTRLEAAPKRSSDDVLLLHGMLLMAGSAGTVGEAEVEMIEAFCATLPEFDGKDFDVVHRQAKELASRFGDLRESVGVLRDLSSDALKRKCFVLSADAALASGNVDDNGDRMFDAVRRTLGIDDATSAKVLEVLSWK